MAPFPHCLGPVGSALPACPLKGLSLLSSEPSTWPSVSAEEWAEHIQREPLAARSLAHWADKAEAGTQSEGESEVQTTLWVNVGLFNTPPKGRTDAC